MKIKDIMTREVQTVAPTDSLQTAAVRMRANDCGSVPVLEGGRVVGIITDRDIVIRAVAQGDDFFKKTVADVMSGDVAGVREGDDARKAEDLMQRKQVRRLVVYDAKGHLSGIVSLADVAATEERRKAGEVLESVSKPGAGAYTGPSPLHTSGRRNGNGYNQNQGYGEAGQGRGVS